VGNETAPVSFPMNEIVNYGTSQIYDSQIIQSIPQGFRRVFIGLGMIMNSEVEHSILNQLGTSLYLFVQKVLDPQKDLSAVIKLEDWSANKGINFLHLFSI
jgi:hypothetical protein